MKLSFSTSLFALLLFSCCLLQGEGIRCYDCYSLRDLFCNDPFRKNSTATKEYPPGNVCVKLKGNLSKEDGFVIRREGMLEAQFDELKRSKTYPEGTQMEKCHVDLCNAAGASTASVAVAVAAVAAAAGGARLWR
ncbi:hypothetical protein R5R35_010288 [Gryllus longicercus]|uniref:Protein sleepless n=1 Tax=Gryllus longicercus TaxID=2509291 RepID=A0AAN9VFW5_9ORTH